jgi:glycosyltransferase involved in cell wall biosynthesis
VAEGLEHILIDAQSSDTTPQVISKYSDLVDSIVVERDRGPADGLNKGFALCTGEIFGYINADDAYMPDTFTEVLEVFQRHPEVDIVYGDGWMLDGQGEVRGHIFSDRFTITGYKTGSLLILQQATFFRREAFLRSGGFNVNNSTCWDSELVADMLHRGAKALHVNLRWGAFSVYPESITGSGRLNHAHVSDKIRVRKKMGAYYAGQTLVLPAVMRTIRLFLTPRSFLWRFAERLFKRPLLISKREKAYLASLKLPFDATKLTVSL